MAAATLGWCLLAAGTGNSQTTSGEVSHLHYQFLANLLYQISLNTEWPSDAFPSRDSPFIVGILGQDPFKQDIDVIKGQSVNGHKLGIKNLQNVKEAKGCHVLFISSSEEKRLSEILKSLEEASVLTISEINGFTAKGGMIGIEVRLTEGTTRDFGKPSLQIKRESAEKARLLIGSRLLNLARK